MKLYSILLLDSNKIGGLNAMNVIWNFSCLVHHRRQLHNRRCMWQKVGGGLEPSSLPEVYAYAFSGNTDDAAIANVRICY